MDREAIKNFDKNNFIKNFGKYTDIPLKLWFALVSFLELSIKIVKPSDFTIQTILFFNILRVSSRGI